MQDVTVPTTDPTAVPDVQRLCSGFLLRRLSRRVTLLYDRHLQPADLRLTHYTLLSWLRSGPQPMSALADVLGMDRSTLTRNVRPLVTAGLVRQTRHDPGQGDARVVTLSLTQAGLAAWQRARPYWKTAQQAIQASIGDDDWRLLQQLSLVAFQRLPTEPEESH